MKSFRSRLPRTARDIIRFRPWQWLVYTGAIRLARITGAWRYPIAASGDAETMTLNDKIYWVYKAQYPVTRAQRRSGLERYFDSMAAERWSLPEGFTPSAEITLSAAGDLMDHPYLPNSAGVLYEEVADLLFDTDISVANLECVIDPGASTRLSWLGSQVPPLCWQRPIGQAVEDQGLPAGGARGLDPQVRRVLGEVEHLHAVGEQRGTALRGVQLPRIDFHQAANYFSSRRALACHRPLQAREDIAIRQRRERRACRIHVPSYHVVFQTARMNLWRTIGVSDEPGGQSAR